jgi:hypothetical protein
VDGCADTGSDTQQVAWFDNRLGKYVAYRRMHMAGKARSGDCEFCVPGLPLRCGTPDPANRQVGRCISENFQHFPGCADGAPGTKTPATLGENASMVFSFDELDAPSLDACAPLLRSFRPTRTDVVA